MSLAPLKKRPLDLVLCLAFAGFAMSTFTVDLWAVTGWIHGDDALAAALRGYTQAADPLFGLMPPHVWVLMFLSLLIFGPMDVWVVLALWRGDERIRVPGLMFAGAQMTAMLSYFGFQLVGDLPPTSWATVIAANGPYLVFPAVLAWRLRRAPVFGVGE